MKGAGAGRPPKPTVLHKLHGTARKDRTSRPLEPQPVGDLSEAPEWMDEDQRAGWDYAIRHCPPGLLKLIDRGTLVMWVEAENRHRIATVTQSALNRGNPAPYLIRGPDGMMISPYVDIIDRATKVMFRAGDAMGFSPVARPRLKLEQPAAEQAVDKSPWALLRIIPGGKSDDQPA